MKSFQHILCTTKPGFFVRSASVYALCALAAMPALGQTQPVPATPPAGDDSEVKVSDYGTVDISVQDTDLAVVLQMLSIEAKKNIITSKNVSATVTANLYDVTFQEALKAILDVNGYTYYEEGNFIYVITKEEWEAMEKARRKTESRVFELEYLSATDANESILPLLSADGKSAARGDVQPGMKPDTSDGGADSYAFTARLVVNDYPENLEAISALLGNLDTPPQQVLVEATILQTALDEANAFGVDFSVIGGLNFSDLTNPLSAVTNLLNGGDSANGVQPDDNEAQAISTSVGNTGGPGGLKIGFVSNDVSVFLRVLDEVTDSTVLARPKVMALNRQRAEVLVGARVGYLSTTATETTTTQSVEFLDTGIQLVFRPFISKDGMIRMELKPSVSEASLRAVTDANGLIVTIPDELTNELTTNVRVKDGQTLVLGGLFKDSTRITRRQVPILGDVPILGAAFRGQDDSVERQEIIFLITPTIMHDEALWANGADAMDTVDSLRVGARSGLLSFSQEKVTSNYNQKAMDAFTNGDNDKSLHYIGKSLGLNGNQPEMIRLREKITGERAKAHERSLMERVLRKQMGETPLVNAGRAAGTSWSNGSTSAAAKTPTAIGSGHDQSSDSTTTDSSVEPMPMTADLDGTSDEVSSEVTETVSVDDLQQNDVAVSDGLSAVSDDSTIESQHSTADSQQPTALLTPQEEIFYQAFLYDFFTTIGMQQVAVQYESAARMYAQGHIDWSPEAMAGVTGNETN